MRRRDVLKTALGAGVVVITLEPQQARAAGSWSGQGGGQGSYVNGYYAAPIEAPPQDPIVGSWRWRQQKLEKERELARELDLWESR